jgi:hypothetical protein
MLPAQVISYQELAADEQLVTGPATRRVLHANKESYRLVVVDEGHALRNPDTTWYKAMERLLGGSRKDLVLLTATPINNGLMDLYYLVMAFARHDRAFVAQGVESVRDLFIAAGARSRDAEDLDPDLLFPLADAVSVRRERRFIEEQWPDAVFPDGTPVRFPRPTMRTLRYDLDQAHPGLVERVVEVIEGLFLALYRPHAYEPGDEETQTEAALEGLLRSGLLKRFESSWWACLCSVRRMMDVQRDFLRLWDDLGIVLPRRAFRGANATELDEAGLAEWMEEQQGAGSVNQPLISSQSYAMMSHLTWRCSQV